MVMNKPKNKIEEGVYTVDSDKLAYGYVSGNYSDQGCVTVTWTMSIRHIHSKLTTITKVAHSKFIHRC
jgi:hypothetical protein